METVYFIDETCVEENLQEWAFTTLGREKNLHAVEGIYARVCSGRISGVHMTPDKNG